jgi:uncharacterized membrane protein YeiH
LFLSIIEIRFSAASWLRLSVEVGLGDVALSRISYRIINRMSSPVLVFDAAGLVLFAVSGAGKALAFHAGPSRRRCSGR